MGNGIGLRLEVRLNVFKCFICYKPITLRPIPELPVDPVEALEELRAGKKPSVCMSCGREHPFNRSRPAFRRYLQFLAMHITVDPRELEDMA